MASCFYVLYVPSLASNILSVYQMNHTGVPKGIIFSSNHVEITEIASRNLIETRITNHHAKTYEFSNFLLDANPTTLLIHGNEVNRICHEIFGHLNFKYLYQLQKHSMVEGLPKPPVEFVKVVLSANTLSKNLIGEKQAMQQVFWG